MGYLFNLRYVSGLVAPVVNLLPPIGDHRPPYLVSCDAWQESPTPSSWKQIKGRYIPILFDFGSGTREHQVSSTVLIVFVQLIVFQT